MTQLQSKNKLDSQKDLCLILTSCIKVADPNFLRVYGRHDSGLRLQDTLKALNYWLNKQKAVDKLVFVDNSSYDLTPLQELASKSNHKKQIEFISFQTIGYTKEKGRSFGELDIMKKALNTSHLLKTTSHFAKVNARIIVDNSDRILMAMRNDFDIIGRLSHNLTWFSTVFFAFHTKVFAHKILPYAWENVNDVTRNYIERVYAKAVLKCIADDLYWYPFPVEPSFKGLIGLNNKSYGRDKLRMKIINWTISAYHKAFDHSSGLTKEHPQTFWKK